MEKNKKNDVDRESDRIKKLDIQNQLNHDFKDIDPENGLNDGQVVESKKKYGINEIESKKRPSVFVRFLKQLIEPLSILLLISAIISLVLAIIETINSVKYSENNKVEIITMYADVAVVLLIVLGNSTFSVIQEGKTLKNLDSLKNMTSPVTKVLRNGEVKIIDSKDVVVGDILVLEAGDKVVADAIILEDAMLETDESLLTGESLPIKKDAEAVVEANAPIADQKNKIFSGTSIVSGRLTARVYAVGMKTQMGNIAYLLNNEKEQLSPLQKQIQKLSKYIGIAVLFISVISFFVYIIVLSKGAFDIKDFWNNSLDNSIALAIATIPEGLIALVMVVLSRSVKYMASKNALIKKLPSVEVLGSASVICSDKTGTLTQNKMTVTKVWQADVQKTLSDVSDADKKLLEYATLCTNGTLNILEDKSIQLIGDPTETSIVKALYDLGVTKDDLEKRFDRIEEIPFDSDRKLMTVILKSFENPDKYLVVVKGALDSLLPISSEKSKEYFDLINENSQKMGEKALRVLAVGYKWIQAIPDDITSENIENNIDLLGLIGIIDPIRPEAKMAIEECMKAGIRAIMITGDHKNTASAIAKELGILGENQKAISGTELDQLSEKEFMDTIEDYSVYARVSPEDKIRIVKAWQAKDKIVSMTGDGVNDAPSLKAADIGCAMGITGTDVSKEAADMILTDDNFATIVSAVKEGRHVLQNIKKILLLLLTTNLSCLMTIFFGILTFGINILSSLQILWINVISETLPGIALGVNKTKENVMLDKPRHKKANIVDKTMFIKIMFFSCFITIISLISFYVGLGVALANYHNSLDPALAEITRQNAFNISWIWVHVSSLEHFVDVLSSRFVYANQIMAASSFSFLTLGLCLSSNAMSFRTKTSIFKESWNDQKWVLLSFFSSIGLLALCAYTPGMNLVFNMNPLNIYGPKEWILFLPYALTLSLIALHELIKFITSKQNKTASIDDMRNNTLSRKIVNLIKR